MKISFEKLEIGKEYDRRTLTDLWEYKGRQAISRGVVTPRDTNFIILFVTEKKQSSATQYKDHVDGKKLHWEGEEKHGSDERIINASRKNDEIHLFYRKIHRSPFTYMGKVVLKDYEIFSDRPSKFFFDIAALTEFSDPIDDIEAHKHEWSNLEKTQQESIIKSRIGQGIFRERVIGLWNGCSVTGLSNVNLLRASHIKPWRNCSNVERLDPMNGLLLHPALDHLFDSGLITFREDGPIIISDGLLQNEMEVLNISRNLVLKKVPNKLGEYMNYHRDHIFRPS